MENTEKVYIPMWEEARKRASKEDKVCESEGVEERGELTKRDILFSLK